MKSKLASFALVAGLLMVSISAFAHHGRQGYDNTKFITIKGTVTEFVWENPHSQIYLDAKDEQGKVINWGIELSSPGNLTRVGWTHNALKAGDEITAKFHPGENGRHLGLCAIITKNDGSTLNNCMGAGGGE